MPDKVTTLLTVPLDDAWDAASSLEVFTDQGGGVIDYNTPLLRVPLATLVKIVEPLGVGADPVGALPIGHGLAEAEAESMGVGSLPIGEGPIGTSLAVIEVEARVEQGVGFYKFAARVVDKAGNIQEDAPTEFSHWVSGEEPPAPTKFFVEAYDVPSDQFTFGFEC